MTERVLTVTKCDWRGAPVYSWHGGVVADDGETIVLRCIWDGPGTPELAPGIRCAYGDVFYEYYARGRPYGLWQVFDPTERVLRCWYCNVSSPSEVTEGGIIFRDLLLDVVVLPDGAVLVLDRDELADALREGLSGSDVALAESAVREIVAAVAAGRRPFDRLDTPPAM